MNSAANPAASPRSWQFQWYIHAVADNAKAAELDRIYGPGPSTLRAVAETVWNTCQAHHPGTNGLMFLPWHRMYLLAFENIIRAVLSDDDFTLPYWDYTRPGQRSIPVEFRSPGVPDWASLYRSNRGYPGLNINAGEPMDKGSTVSPFNLNVLTQPNYPLFCLQIDNGIHGNVHGGVGDFTNMGSIDTAPRDPIFWLHHCNIDRMWAGWDQGGGQDPVGAEQFAFASPNPAGELVRWSSANVGRTESLGYRYADLPPKPTGPISAGTAGGPPRTLAVSGRGIRLDAPATRVPLAPATVDGVISGSVASATATGRIYLVLSDLRSNLDPGTLYEAFVDLPANPTARQKRDRYLGTFSFFGASGEHVHDYETKRMFEVTEQLRKLRNRNLLSASPAVTIIPVRPGQSGAVPIVGVIELVRR